jgi:hypothetical protein
LVGIAFQVLEKLLLHSKSMQIRFYETIFPTGQKSIFGKVTTEVHLMAVPVEEVADLLITDPAGEALQPSGATIFTLNGLL